MVGKELSKPRLAQLLDELSSRTLNFRSGRCGQFSGDGVVEAGAGAAGPGSSFQKDPRYSCSENGTLDLKLAKYQFDENDLESSCFDKKVNRQIYYNP